MMKNEAHLAYRPDIDGLRAVSVLIVILYHAGLQGFTGGFVGVDVFFVISGFLITTILLRQFLNDQFSLKEFYFRRVRRIFPALVMVVGAAAVGAYFLLLPNEFALIGPAIRWVALFASNHKFLASEADYWQQNTLSSQPFLHTWSLAIEEQFYIFFPLVLWLLFSVRRSILKRMSEPAFLLTIFTLFVFISAGSFWMSHKLLAFEPTTSFYVLHSRAWELLLGSLLALLTLAIPLQLPTWLASLIGACGLALILACTFYYGHDTQFPGLYAVFPCLGAVMVVSAGFTKERSWFSSLLSLKPLVFIGLLSYSLYLWHWPVFVFARSAYWTYWDLGTPPLWMQILVTFILSFLTWRFIETPFRSTTPAHSRSKSLATAVCVLALIFGLGKLMSSIAEDNFPFAQRTPEALANLIPGPAQFPYRVWESKRAGLAEEVIKDGGGTIVGDKNAEPSFIVTGDSFANMWGKALDSLAKENGTSGLLLGLEYCASLVGLARMADPACLVVNNAKFSFIERSNIKKVVIAIRWKTVAVGPGKVYVLSDHPSEQRLLYITLERTLKRLEKANKQVFLVLDVPGSVDVDPYTTAIQSAKGGGKEIYNANYKKYLEENRDLFEILAKFKKKYHFEILDPSSKLCSDEGCVVARQGQPIYHDGGHLSYYGANFIAGIFNPVLSGSYN